MKSLGIRALIVAGVLIVGIFCLVPTFSSTPLPGLSSIMPDKIHLGLDLQGGIYLVLEVEADKAVENKAERFVEEIKDALRAKKIGFTKVARTGAWNIEVILPSNEQLNEFNEALKSDFPALTTVTTETVPDGARLLLTLDQKEINNLRKMAVEQGLETIRNRIDQFGVSEPDIRPEAGDRILIELPGIKNPQDAINLIGKMAVLDFKLVAQNVTDQEIHDNKLPPGVKLYPMKPSDRNAQESKLPLEEKTVLTGEHITDARVEIGQRSFGEAHISVNFDSQGAKIFERLTRDNVGRKLAIVLDGTVYSDPVIREPIPNGRAVIEGSFTDEEATSVAIALRTGRLPAPV